MYQILDYKKRAIDMLIPYLLEFPQIISIVEQSADRYQEIEKVLWELITNLRLDDSRGIWLTNKTNNTATSIIYTDMAKDAFTYGTDNPEAQGYGAGHYYSQANYISGTNLSISEQKQIRGIKSKIIRNNFDGTIESFIKALKLLFNADKVIISESYPLGVSLMMKGNNLEISSSYMYEQVKHLLASCVKLNNIFIDNNTYNVFQYDNKKAFGDSRYPALITDTLDIIQFKGKCIKFTSSNKMYCKVPVLMDTNKVFVVCGRLYKNIDTYSTIMSSNDGTNNISIYIDGDNKINLTINDTTQVYDIPIETNLDYTFVYYQSKLWVISGCKLIGDYDADVSYISSLISYQSPSIKHTSTLGNIKSDIYINALVNNNGSIDNLSYGDFIYYNMVVGNKESDTLSLPNYYVTSYGETKVLFNVANNYDHLKINMSNRITRDFYEEQSVFKYESSHTDERHVLLESGDKIVYNTVGGASTNLELGMELFLPDNNIEDKQRVLSLYNQDNITELLHLDVIKRYGYNKEAFTVVGNPTVSREGIASGFNNINYLKTAIDITPSNKLVIKSRIIYNTLGNSSSYPNAKVFWGTNYNGWRLVTNYGNTIQLVGGDLGSINLNIGAMTDGDIIDTELIITQTNVTINATKNGTEYTTTEPKTVTFGNITSIVIGNTVDTSNYYFTGQIDLSQFSITVDGQTVVNGASTTSYPNINNNANIKFTLSDTTNTTQTFILPLEEYKHNKINLNINNKNILFKSQDTEFSYTYNNNILQNIGNTVTIGNTYNGIISNVSVKTDLYNLVLPFETTLNNTVYSHTNIGGAKFITIPSNIVNKNKITID